MEQEEKDDNDKVNKDDKVDKNTSDFHTRKRKTSMIKVGCWSSAR